MDVTTLRPSGPICCPANGMTSFPNGLALERSVEVS